MWSCGHSAEGHQQQQQQLSRMLGSFYPSSALQTDVSDVQIVFCVQCCEAQLHHHWKAAIFNSVYKIQKIN